MPGDQLPERLELVAVLGENQDVVAALGGRADQVLDEIEDEGVVGGQLLGRHVEAELHVRCDRRLRAARSGW